MKNAVIFKILISLGLAIGLQAQGLLPSLGGQRVATSAFSFLKIDPSASASAIGHASVANDRNASVMHWNPAALVQLSSFAASASHLQWFTGIQYDYFALALPVAGNTAIGIDGGILHMDPMEITNEYNPYGSGEWFTFQDYFLSLAWSQRMSDRFSFGVTAKYITERYLNLRTNGIMMDLGTWYFTGYKDLRIAVSLLNFGSPIAPAGTFERSDLDGNVFTDKYETFAPPTTFQLGAAISVINTSILKVTTLFQLNHPVDNAETYVFAVESEVLKSLSLRAGYDISGSEAPLTYGFGLHPGAWKNGLSVDYAVQDHPYLGRIQQMQLNIYFNK